MSTWQEDDLVDLVAGEFIGGGCYRKTFVYKLDSSLVIKRSTHDNHRHNIVEYEMWEAVRGTPIEKWFAPVVAISDIGLWLIMKRTKPILTTELPKHVPAMLTDLKPTNWGWYEGNQVCHDYGNAICRIATVTGKRMRAANWFGMTGY